MYLHLPALRERYNIFIIYSQKFQASPVTSEYKTISYNTSTTITGGRSAAPNSRTKTRTSFANNYKAH